MEVPSQPQSPLSKAPSASGEVLTNEPLSPDFVERFEGKLVREHPYLSARGLTPELVEHFGLGFCPPEAKSMMKGRVTIPIHNVAGELLAYVGRFVGDELPEGSGKYLFPTGFHKHLVVYNQHRVLSRQHLIVVEGFFDVFRLHSLGVPTVALMGSSLSEEQVVLLRTAGVRYLTFLLDGDDAGREAVPAMMVRLARESFLCKFAVLPEGSQPDTVPDALLCELLRLKN